LLSYRGHELDSAGHRVSDLCVDLGHPSDAVATVPGPLRQHTGGPALGIQIGFGWTDFHLHRFRVQKKSYTTPRIGSVEGHDALQVKLMALQFRINERFLYEDDFGDLWQHEIRIEKHCVIENGRTYLVCVGGKWGGPPEDCGGPDAFMARRSAAAEQHAQCGGDSSQGPGGSERLDHELGPERAAFIEGCQRDWDQLPVLGPRLTVGLDGGTCTPRSSAPATKGGLKSLSVKSSLDDGNGKCFAYVQTYDNKPRRRLFEFLKSHGVQENHAVRFLTDGGAMCEPCRSS